MIVRCNWCFAVLEEPGALVFTPPDRLGQCTKIHVCVECFKRVILSATPKRSDDGAPKSLLGGDSSALDEGFEVVHRPLAALVATLATIDSGLANCLA